jgi:hypothetical protein
MVLKIVSICAVAALSIFAAESGSFDLGKAKSRATENLDKEMKVLNDAKNCVSAAKSKAELQACREKAKIDLKAVKTDSHTK